MRNKPAVVSRLASVSPSACSISSVTGYEFYTGVEKCADPVREKSKVTRLLRTVSVAPFDLAAGIEAAQIRAMLESLGQMIGPYDVLLAGHAKAMASRLVSHNPELVRRLKPHWRWTQSSIRSMLLLTAGRSIWLGLRVNEVRREREALALVASLGGQVASIRVKRQFALRCPMPIYIRAHPRHPWSIPSRSSAKARPLDRLPQPVPPGD